MLNLKLKLNLAVRDMEKVSLLAFRRDAESIIRKVQRGKRLILTYRGQPVMRLEPIVEEKVDPADPIYTIYECAVSGASLTNEEIDGLLYEE